MKLEVPSEMTAASARDLTDRIKTAADNLAEILYQAHEGKAWKALGYQSWQAYCTAEFQFSKQRSYQLLHFVEIKRSLDTSQPGLTPISEKQVRSLAKLKPEQQSAAWKQAVEMANGEQPTTKQVEVTVSNFTEFTPSVYHTRADPSWTPSQVKRKEQVEKGKTVLANMSNDDPLIAWANGVGKLVKIDRYTDWGNPFVAEEDGTDAEVLVWFEEYFGHKASLRKRVPSVDRKSVSLLVLSCQLPRASLLGIVG